MEKAWLSLGTDELRLCELDCTYEQSNPSMRSLHISKVDFPMTKLYKEAG